MPESKDSKQGNQFHALCLFESVYLNLPKKKNAAYKLFNNHEMKNQKKRNNLGGKQTSASRGEQEEGKIIL